MQKTILGMALLVLVAITTACGSDSADSGNSASELVERREVLRRQVRSAENELAAIDHGGLYMLVNTESGELKLKMKGSELLRLPVQSFDATEPATGIPTCNTATMPAADSRSDSAFNANAPAAVAPDAEVEVAGSATSRSNPGESGPPPSPISVADMPSKYTLDFTCEATDQGLVVRVGTGVGLSVDRGLRFATHQLGWLASALGIGAADPTIVRFLDMEPDDAQRLYWAVRPGVRMIVE